MKRELISLCAALFALSSCNVKVYTYNSYANADKYHMLENEESFSANVSKLSIDYVAGSINLMSKAEYTNISIVESPSEAIGDDLKARVYESDEGLLSVKYCKSGLTYERAVLKDLYVYVPLNYSFSSIELNIVSCHSIVNEITSDLIEINGVSGDIEVSDSDAKKIEINGVSGKVKLNLTNTTKQVYLNTVSGDMFLNIPESTPGFTLEFSAVSGKFKNPDFPVTTNENKRKYGDDPSNLLIDSNGVSAGLTLAKYLGK